MLITLAASRSLAPTSQITISAWIRPDFSVANGIDDVLQKRDGCGFNRSYELAVYKASNGPNLPVGTIIFSPSVANDDVNSTTPVPNDGLFHHIAGVYDGIMMKVYLDGVQVGQLAHSGPIPITSGPTTIGVEGGCGNIAVADISNVKLFDRALSDQEISSSGNFALLSGSNTFSGNQTVQGSVSATSFSGDGSQLTNVAAVTANTANTAATANFANTASSAANATNASALGGVAAANYARLDVGNSFTGNESVTGNVSVSGNLSSGGSTTIGGGTPITKHISNLFTNVTFNTKLGPAICPVWMSSSSATDGDTVVAGLSAPLMSANIVYATYVINGAVSIRICNPTGAPTTIGSGNIETPSVPIF